MEIYFSSKEDLEKTLVSVLVVGIIFLSSPFPFAFAEGDETPPADPSAQETLSGETLPQNLSEEEPSSDTATVETGDAVAVSETETDVNVNVVDTHTADVASSTEDTAENVVEENPTIDSMPPGGGNVFATSTNEAVASTTVETVANTGGNSVSGNGGGAIVATGNAYAAADVVNVVNFNVFDSYGFFALLSNVFGSLGNIDLRGAASGFGSSSGCSTCIPSETTVLNTNVATVTNAVVVRSGTGGNTASGNGGDGLAVTGDAYATANVVNMVNTNITNSNYMMVVLNNFGGWDGDFVLPNGDFFQQFFTGQEKGNGSMAVQNNNTASVSNNVTTSAETGGNEASGNDGTAVIATGDAMSGTTVVNHVNQNLFGGSSVVLLFRIFGNWNGNVFNAPPGILWQETPYGVELIQDPTYGSTNAGGCPECLGSTTVKNNNSAQVENNVEVYALTGENKVNGNGGAATIGTGDAYAAANVVNMVNSNIYGRNWILAIVNIFGDWNGNISFGEPDLWLGAMAEAPEQVGIGTSVLYKFTIANRGDADAHNVHLEGTLDFPFITFGDSNTPSGSWSIGTVKAGETIEVSYPAYVNDSLPSGATPITLSATLTQTEPDHNQEDNTDTVTLFGFRASEMTGVSVAYTPDPDIVVTKTNDVIGTITSSTTVNYTITLKNNGGEAYHAVLRDILSNDLGDMVGGQEWDLDTIFPDEEITVTYTLHFNEETPPGVYINSAHVEAIGRNPSVNPLYGVLYSSMEATSTVVVLGDNSAFMAVGTIEPQESQPAQPPTVSPPQVERVGGIPSISDSAESLKNKILPGVSADSVDPFVPHAGALAGAGFALPRPGSLDLFLLLIVVLLLILNKMSFKEFEEKLKDRFASFL